MEHINEEEEHKALYYFKDISYKEGVDYFRNKMKNDYPESESNQKTSFVYFWDSTDFGFRHANSMRSLDSLANVLGKYSFNYVFATEMDETIARDYLVRNNALFSNFKVLGSMDNYMSGVYNKYPVKFKIFGKRMDTTQASPFDRMKIKGYYLLMDNKDTILYHNYKCFPTSRDSVLMQKIRTLTNVKTLKKLD